MFALALLQKAGHKVDIVENGHQAVDAVRHNDYDVVLMDVQMPELDGIGAMREIRTLAQPKCKIPIVAMTANAMSGAEAQYLSAGMDDYVSKPVQPELLFQKLSRIGITNALRQPQAVAPMQVENDLIPLAATDHGTADLPVLQPEKLQHLISALSPLAVRDFLNLYRTDTQNHIARIQELLTQQDLKGVARLAHEVVSTAGNVGIEQVTRLRANWRSPAWAAMH